MNWKTSKRTIFLDRPLVMGILNVTSDSFSDGGKFVGLDSAVRRADEMLSEGVDIIDVGGESTRPGSSRVDTEHEIERIAPVVEAIAKRCDIPISVDTTKLSVAKAALDSGAEIINDVSGLRWEPALADLAARSGAGLVLMHSRGEFATMHSLPPVSAILEVFSVEIGRAIKTALESNVLREQLVIDIGIGFGKTHDQNLELIAKLDRLVDEFDGLPILVGVSRKSFIGAVLGGLIGPEDRLPGSLSATAVAIWNGANLIRCHDVKATKEAIMIASAIKNQL